MDPIKAKLETFCRKMNKLAAELEEFRKEINSDGYKETEAALRDCLEQLEGKIGNVVGKRIRFGDMEWTVLDQDEDRLFIVLSSLLPDTYKFDHDGRNVWAKSSLRDDLHKWLEEWSEASGVEDYLLSMSTVSMNEAAEVLGTSTDRVRLLTLEEQLRYRRLGYLPKYDDWQWTITANRSHATNAWIVSTSGNVYAGNAYNASRCAPSVCISLEAPFERID